jgi:hypothetical protein
LRRRPFNADELKELQAAAEAKRGPPTTVTADSKWLQQELIHGLSAILPFHSRGLTIGMDGWLYVATGSNDNRAEGWDGSTAVLLKTGGILRTRPDGSQLREFARGLRSPCGGIAFDELGNGFLLDDDLGSGKFDGVRLIHLLEGADYGWRQRPDLVSAPYGSNELPPDLARAAGWGERPGALGGIHKIGNGSPADVLLLTSLQFPEFLRGLLVVAGPSPARVRAYSVVRERETFKAVSQFDLMQCDGPTLRPSHAVQGPDGAIYVADHAPQFRDGKSGRIYRLSWEGNAEHPAIPLAPLDSWQQVAAGSEDQLAALLSSDESELRRRAAIELVRRARHDASLASGIAARSTTIAYDDSRLPPVRAAALAVAAQLMDVTAFEALLLMLDHENADIQRLAADALGDHPPAADADLRRVIEALQQNLLASQPGVPRSRLMAHGKLAGNVDAAEWAFEAVSVTYRPSMGSQIFDGHVRALEMTKDAGRDLLLGNLDVAINFPDADAKERERMKEFVVVTAESMRTRELAAFLDALLRGEADLLAKLDPPHQVRLIAAYRNVQVEPPINADAVAEWLEKHPGRPLDVELAALETLSLAGTTKPDAVTGLANRLLANPDHAKDVAARLLAGRLGRELQESIAAALRKHAENDKSGEIATLLKKVTDLPP